MLPSEPGSQGGVFWHRQASAFLPDKRRGWREAGAYPADQPLLHLIESLGLRRVESSTVLFAPELRCPFRESLFRRHPACNSHSAASAAFSLVTQAAQGLPFPFAELLFQCMASFRGQDFQSSAAWISADGSAHFSEMWSVCLPSQASKSILTLLTLWSIFYFICLI